MFPEDFLKAYLETYGAWRTLRIGAACGAAQNTLQDEPAKQSLMLEQLARAHPAHPFCRKPQIVKSFKEMKHLTQINAAVTRLMQKQQS